MFLFYGRPTKQGNYTYSVGEYGDFGYLIMIYLTGDIFRRRLSSAEIIFGGDNFRHHFCQISALISAEMFSNIKFSTVAMNVPSYFYSCMYDLFHSRVGQYLLLGVNFGCDGAGDDDVIYFTSNHLGISPSVFKTAL